MSPAQASADAGDAHRAQSLAGKRVLVTGAGIGIGRGIAIECARAGADVALHHVDELAGADSAAAEIRALGRLAVVLRGDFRLITDVHAVAERAEQALGGIDILVNNAGITATCPFAEVTDALFDTLFAVNVKAMYFMTQRIAQGMAASGGGVVVNLASLHAWFGVREHSLYAATKGAIVSLTSQLAVELAPLGIRVNAVAPGTCVGENQRAADPMRAGVDAPHLPAGYFSVPADVGRLVVFLAGPQADYFVGKTLRFDGGYSVLFPTMPDFRVPLPSRQGERYLAPQASASR